MKFIRAPRESFCDKHTTWQPTCLSPNLDAKTGILCIFVNSVHISSKHGLPTLSLNDSMDNSIKTKDDCCTSPTSPRLPVAYPPLFVNFWVFKNKLNLARLKSASKAITPSGWLQVNKDG